MSVETYSDSDGYIAVPVETIEIFVSSRKTKKKKLATTESKETATSPEGKVRSFRAVKGENAPLPQPHVRLEMIPNRGT